MVSFATNARKEEKVGDVGTMVHIQRRLEFFDTPIHCVGLLLASLTLLFASLSIYHASAAWSGSNAWLIHAKDAMICGLVALILAFFQPPLIYMAAHHFERKRGVKGWPCLKVAGFLGYVAAWVHGALLLKRGLDEGCGVQACTIPASSIIIAGGLVLVPWVLMFGYAESARLGGKGSNETTIDDDDEEEQEQAIKGNDLDAETVADRKSVV